MRKAVIHRAQSAVLKQGVCPAKDKINVSGDLAGVVILRACPAGCQPARAQKAVLLPLFLRQRGAEQGILIAQQPHTVKRRPGAVHIGCDGLPRLCAGACVVLDGHILHPQLLPAEKGSVAAEGVGGPPVRVRQLAAVVPYQPGGIHARARKGDILFLTNQLFPVNARRDADDRRAVVGHRQHRLGNGGKLSAAVGCNVDGKHKPPPAPGTAGLKNMLPVYPSFLKIATETLPPLSALFQPEHGGGDIVRAAGLLCADAGGLHQRLGQLFRCVSCRRRKLHLLRHPARAIHQ